MTDFDFCSEKIRRLVPRQAANRTVGSQVSDTLGRVAGHRCQISALTENVETHFGLVGGIVKLILCITREDDANRLIERLVEQEFRATRIPTSGGFLKRGNSTVVIGVEDYAVEAILELARDVATHANIFVLDVARYERL